MPYQTLKRSFNATSKGNVEKLIEKAKTFLPAAPMPLEVIFEHIGEGTFYEKSNGAVFSPSRKAIVINIEWYEHAEEQDLKYLIWHETRHAYQRTQIGLYQQGLPTDEVRKRVKKWAYEFEHYIQNSPEYEQAHMNQDIEIDAYAFALYLLFMICPNEDGSIDIGLPPSIEDEVLRRVSAQNKGVFRCY